MKPEELQKVAEGREAEMFAWEQGTLLRLFRDAAREDAPEREEIALKAARSSGVRVPVTLGRTTVMGRPGLIMERIEGTDMLTLVGRKPWRVFQVAKEMGELHATIHEGQAPEGLRALRATVRQAIESSELVPKDMAEFALSKLDKLPDGDRVCHLDFHPANVIVSAEGPVVIDWTNVMRGDPAADVARSLLMTRMGELPPGTPLLVHPIALVGRNILSSFYLRSYRRRRTIEANDLRRWEVPVAAARLVENIPEERKNLLKFLGAAIDS